MSGISSSSAAGTSGSTSTVGTDLAPITFPGISSGIDYNAIITKLTALTLAPKTTYTNQITQLNAKNAELIKINGLLASVQNSLAALSDPATFNAYVGTSTDPLDAGVSQIPGSTGATPGTYTIAATKSATSTQVFGGATAGVALNLNTALISAGTAITPTNGTGGQQGILTVDGVSVAYDVNSQSLSTIVTNIYTAVHAVDAGFSIAASSTGAISISSTDESISLGSSADRGNLQHVLKLDVAQIDNSGPPNSVTSAGAVGGVNIGTPLSAANNAGFATAITSGTFTINGVQINVDTATDNVAGVIARINASTAGVVAAYDLTSNTFSLSNKASGAQSIVVGASGDTSNFLRAAELTTASGASTAVGKQAYVALLTASGALHTVYSNSNTISSAIPGFNITVSGTTTTPFSVTVRQDPSIAINAITSFISVYNAAVNEIAIATAPPIVQQSQSSTSATTSTSSVIAQGGVLYGDATIQSISYQLTQLVTRLNNSSSTSYNSLSSIGINLDSSHTVFQSNTDSFGGTVNSATTGAISSKIADGTDGQLLPLDIAKFTAAFAADPNAVENLFTSPKATAASALGANLPAGDPNLPSGLAYQLGAYLTTVTGEPTGLLSGFVGQIPAVALLQGDENAQTAEITSLNKSIKTVTDKANAQADLLRREATASEALVAKYQAEQSSVNQINGSSSSSH